MTNPMVVLGFAHALPIGLGPSFVLSKPTHSRGGHCNNLGKRKYSISGPRGNLGKPPRNAVSSGRFQVETCLLSATGWSAPSRKGCAPGGILMVHHPYLGSESPHCHWQQPYGFRSSAEADLSVLVTSRLLTRTKALESQSRACQGRPHQS